MSWRSWALTVEGGGDMVVVVVVVEMEVEECSAPKRKRYRIEGNGGSHGGAGIKTARWGRERGVQGVGSGWRARVVVNW